VEVEVEGGGWRVEGGSSLRGAKRRGNLVVEPQLTNEIASLRSQ
jgi:hypothetical protein